MLSKKVARRGKRGIVTYVEQKTCMLLHTLPGRVVMWTVDKTYGITETLLFLVRPELRNVRKPEIRNGQNGGSIAINREHIERLAQGNLERFGLFIIFTKPLELLVYLMRGVQTYLHNIADSKPDHSKKNGCLSPEKESEIQSRRKVSPRKKIKTGLVNHLHRTINYFGLTRLMPGLRRKFNIDITGQNKNQLMTSPNKDDEDKKRKYDDILSESETESDDDNLHTLDLDKYLSEEDPDFEAAGGESTDSEEYREGDTESDIEFETTIGGTRQVKVQSKSASKENVPSTVPSAKEEDKGKPNTAKVVDSSKNTKEQLQTKTSPLKATQLSINSPSKSNTKSTALKCSTPKSNSGKENAAPSDSKTTVPKKTPDTNNGSTENSDKKSDSKNPTMANGDKKTEAKNTTNGSKKGPDGNKK